MFDPATNSFAGPYATALVHPQYLAIDINGVVWGTDLAANHFIWRPDDEPGFTDELQHAEQYVYRADWCDVECDGGE